MNHERRAALRVARRLGWFNVDAMLESAEAGQLEEWLAFEAIEPGEHWEIGSLTTTQIVNAIMGIAAAFGTKEAKPLEWDAFVPGKQVSESKRKSMNPTQWVAAFRLQAGV